MRATDKMAEPRPGLDILSSAAHDTRMCGRFTLQAPPETLQELFAFSWPDPSWDPERTDRARYNIAPTQPILVVEGDGSDRRGRWARWGIRGRRGRLVINVRSETAPARGPFRGDPDTRRVLVLADGFIEWRREGKQSVPMLIARRDRMAMAFAGLAARSQSSPAEIAAVILTKAADPEVAPVHDRMPLILDPKAAAQWLDASRTDGSLLKDLLRPLGADVLSMREISERVNRVEHDDPACLEKGPPLLPRQLGFTFDVPRPSVSSERYRGE